MTKRIRLEKCKGAAEREKIVGTGKEKKEFSTKLTEKQQLEGTSVVRSGAKRSRYEANEGIAHYCQSATSMMKIAE